MERLNLKLVSGPRLIQATFNHTDVTNPQKEIPINCEYSFALGRKVDSTEVAVLIGVKCSGESLPFFFEAKADASFECDNTESEEMIIVEATPYIYPFLKDFAADLTRKANFAPFYLPQLELSVDLFHNAKVVTDQPSASRDADKVSKSSSTKKRSQK